MAGISERRASATRVATQKQTLLSRDTVDESVFLSHIPSHTGWRQAQGAPQKRKEENKMAKKETAPYKIYLTENELPTSWYNLRADMKTKPAPFLHPGTLKPLKFEEM